MIDPAEFGELKGKFDAMEKAVEKMSAQMDELMAMANQSKGGLMMLRLGSGFAGALGLWILQHAAAFVALFNTPGGR